MIILLGILLVAVLVAVEYSGFRMFEHHRDFKRRLNDYQWNHDLNDLRVQLHKDRESSKQGLK